MPKIRSAAAIAVAVAGAALGSMLLTAAPASAATAPCPATKYCFYNNANYKGDWHLTYGDTTSGSFNKPPYSSGDKRNQLSAIINNGNRTICIWDDLTLRPDHLIVKVKPYQDFIDLSSIPGANDKADYWKIGGC